MVKAILLSRGSKPDFQVANQEEIRLRNGAHGGLTNTLLIAGLLYSTIARQGYRLN